LILRHFTLATELLPFTKANAGPVEMDSWPLRPRCLEDLRDNVSLQHDLNIYNFIIQLNQSLRAQGRDLASVARPDFTMISDTHWLRMIKRRQAAGLSIDPRGPIAVGTR
jgi:hypothetical protein